MDQDSSDDEMYVEEASDDDEEEDEAPTRHRLEWDDGLYETYVEAACESSYP